MVLLCSAGSPPCMGTVGDNGRASGHPRVKVPVGLRLANLAQKLVYDDHAIITDGPTLAGSPPKPGHGVIELTFDVPV